MEETKIYVIDLNLPPYGIGEELKMPIDEGFDIKAFKEVAEEQGGVYTLEGFEYAYNNELIPYDSYIQIINK